jgi:hypothetical protein
VIEDDEEKDAEQPPPPPHDEAANDGVPPPPMGWTMKIYHKTGHDSISHHRLVRMLAAYFVD